MAEKTKDYKIHRLSSVLFTLICLIILIATKGSTLWAILFSAGLGWFIVLRILKD